MTNSTHWGLLKGANGELLGVRALSGDEPAKTNNFSFADRALKGKTKYSDWLFTIPIKFFPARPHGPSLRGKIQSLTVKTRGQS